MTVERVNPEVILKAAQLARPKHNWVLRDHGVEYDEYEEGMLACSVGFHPEIDMDDAYALDDCLERNGWMFRYNGKSYLGEHDDFWSEYRGYQPIEAESKALRALSCVSAQFSIPLYLEGGE